jgi:integrase
MIGRRKSNLLLGMSRIYAYEGKRTTTYYTITPDNKRINLGHDLNEAKKRLLKTAGEQPAQVTVGDRLDDLLKYRQKQMKAGKLAASTLDTNVAEIVHLKKAFGKMHPQDVTRPNIWSYLHEYRGLEAPVRANREIALLSTMFNRAVGAGLIASNPCAGVKRNEEEPRDRLIAEVELRSFFRFAWRLSDAGKRIALAVGIAYLTGKAQGQILKLTKDQLLAEGIYFPKRKRGAATQVGWTKLLAKMIKAAIAMPSTADPRFVIHTQSGTGYTSSGFKSMWQRLMTEWEEKGNERFTFHDIRAKTVTDVIDQGRKASDLTGHRTEWGD